MKIRNLKTKVIGPALLLIPMACMHMGDDHHSGSHYSFTHQQSYETSTYGSPSGYIGVKGSTISQDDKSGG